MRRKPDPLLRTQPWRMTMVFGPIERILHRLESEGTVEVAGRHVVLKEDGRGGWYDAVAALRGVVEFHQLAQSRHGYPADVEALIKFANNCVWTKFFLCPNMSHHILIKKKRLMKNTA